MAAPVDAGRAATQIATATTPWVCNMPASIAAGDLLIAWARMGSNGQTFLLESGWSWLVDNADVDAADDKVAAMYRIAAGADTLSWDLNGSQKGAVIVWRITGAHASTAPEVSSAATGGAGPVDCPNINAAGGAKDYLALALGSMDGETGTFDAAPSTYSNLVGATSGVALSTTTNVVIAGATKQLTAASSENPGAFTNNAGPNAGWTAYTVLAHPVDVAPSYIPQAIVV